MVRRKGSILGCVRRQRVGLIIQPNRKRSAGEFFRPCGIPCACIRIISIAHRQESRILANLLNSFVREESQEEPNAKADVTKYKQHADTVEQHDPAVLESLVCGGKSSHEGGSSNFAFRFAERSKHCGSTRAFRLFNAKKTTHFGIHCQNPFIAESERLLCGSTSKRWLGVGRLSEGVV